MLDIDGREVTIVPGKRALGMGQLYGICKSTRGGRAHYVAEWLPSGNQARFAGKREAVKFIKAHEDAYYAARDAERRMAANVDVSGVTDGAGHVYSDADPGL